ncbi:MAG TPA: carboxypeptidase regulatory-like domain-containing protein [Acidobacteriaceae bacterium]|nr:carboxypeptidase regulatory-like domain-containing protein [Acidobacteriaceae bacterium]
MDTWILSTLLFACLFVMPRTAISQAVTGSITGTVTDTNGAIIQEAQVVAKNLDTGIETKTTTNNAGAYSIRFLSIGNYQVTVTANGFTAEQFPPFALEVNQTAKEDAQLKVGASNTTTVVTAANSQILNTNDASLGIVMTNKEIQTIPLNGRNFSTVTLFQPGAVNTDPQGLTGDNAIERETYNNGTNSINGNRNQANNYTLDGIDMNEGQNNLIAYNPAPEAIQQIKVITANAPAEYGNVNGGDVLAVLKSGTDHFHGEAYAYLENDNLDANTWGNKNNTPIIPRNPYTQTIFGGTIGGPVLHDKLFFFADYEGARRHTGGTGTASVFPAAMRMGDFSALLHPPNTTTTFQPIQLYDTQNNFAPYPNNKIPSILNPVAKFLFANPSLYPLPNSTPIDGIAENNYQGSTRSFVVNNQGDIKIEWDPRSADKITSFYGQSDPFDGQVAVLAISFPSQNVYPTKLGGGMWVHVFSPSLVNEARVGFTRVRWDNSVPTDPTGQFGIGGNAKVGIPLPFKQTDDGFSFQSLQNNFSGVGSPANVQVIRDNTFSYGDNLTWQHGLHLFSMGVQAIRYQQNYYNADNYGFLGQIEYSGVFTGNPNVTNGGAGFSPADFVLNRVAAAQIAAPGGLVGNRQWRTAGFFQDDWRITPTLTLNLGVRYEYDQPWYEVNNKTANVLLSGPQMGTVIYAGPVPASAPAGSQRCGNRACYQPTYDQIMPRIGFAFQVKPQFVVRGGYGTTSFLEGNAGNQRLTSSPPFIQAYNKKALIPTNTNGGTPYTVQEGFTSASGDINYAGQGYGAWPQNMQPAYIQEFNLTLEYALNSRTSLSAGYIGETGQHLIDYRNGNQLTAPGAVAPFVNLVGQGGVLLVTEPEAMMNYNALQATLRQHEAFGLDYTVNYTYGRAMTNSSGNYGTPNIEGSDGAFQNGYDGAADVGPAGQDIRNNLSFLGVYALPFGQGRRFVPQANRLVDAAIGGWSLSTSFFAYSGFPITMNGPGEINTGSYGQSRANNYRKIIVRHRNIHNWFGTDPSAVPCQGPGENNGVCAYGTAAVNTYGTASVNSERTPGYRQVDASFFKDFHITEGQAVTFRADFFNAFNIASYGNPDNGITDTNFGMISGVRSPPRQVQLSLHYSF